MAVISDDRDILERLAVLDPLAQDVFCLDILQRARPLHMRFAASRPEWAHTTPVIDEAFDALWSRCGLPERPDIGCDGQLAAKLRRVEPSDEDGLMLTVPRIDATWLITRYLAELFIPLDFSTQQDRVRAARYLMEELLDAWYLDVDDPPLQEERAEQGPLAHAAGRREREVMLRHISRLEQGSADLGALAGELRADSIAEGEWICESIHQTGIRGDRTEPLEAHEPGSVSLDHYPELSQVMRLSHARRLTLEAAMIERCLPFHRRFVEQHSEWHHTNALVDEASTVLWTICEQGCEPEEVGAADKAELLRATMPFAADGDILDVPWIDATYYVMFLLAEALHPVAFVRHDYHPGGSSINTMLGLLWSRYAACRGGGPGDIHVSGAEAVLDHERAVRSRHIAWLEAGSGGAGVVARVRADSEAEGRALLEMVDGWIAEYVGYGRLPPTPTPQRTQ